MNATMLFRAMKFNQRQPSPAWKKLAAAFFLNALLPSAVLADVWFLGIGNDGYYTDVSGLRTAYQAVPNPSGTPLHFRTYSNRDGATILQDIGWLADNAGPGDLALFFYSGHGGSGDWSSYDERAGWASNPFDETIGLLSGDEITDDQLALAFARIDSRVPLFGVFDACHSGGMVGGTTDLNTLPNVYAMMSSREDEDSYGGFPYSRFTGELIRGIGYSLPADANDNGIVTFDEWFGYARDNVSGQNPVRFDSGGLGSLSIVPVPEPTTLALLATAAIGLLFWRRNRRFTISKMYSDRGGLDRVRSEIGEEIHRHRQKEDRNIKSHTTTLALGLILLMTGRSVTMAAQIGPDAFENPITFDFSDLAYGSHLGANYPNPYADLGVEFTGYIADYDGYGLHGHHLATGFDNTPPEPFVVRARFLDEPALRVGGYVWPEVGSRTSFTAFDEHGAAIESFTLSGAQFTGLEASVDLPIRYVEWRGLAGSGLSTFPRVDGVMVQRVPEPATLVLLVTAAAGIAFWWRKRRTSLRKTLNDWDGLDRLRFNIGTELRCRQTTGDETMKASATAIALSLVLLTTVGLRNAPAREIGPDAYDYLATNNIPYAWEDISLTGTRTLYGSDDGTASRNLGFPFNFYGHD